ncbi:MerR family transcriptional regulator [Chloroflexota bacterium]
MPVEINDQIYFRTADVCKKASISRTTLFRWLKEGILKDTYLRDRRGWRLFSEDDLKQILNEANKTELI